MSDKLVNVRELSKKLGLSVNTLYCWVSQRKIPYVKCGRLTKFDPGEIGRWIKDNSVKERA